MQCTFVVRSVALTVLLAAAQPARPSDDCDAPTDAWHSRSAVTAWAEGNGWQVERLKIDDGCYEIKGRDAQGRRFKAKVDPATLQVLRIRHEHGDREQERERERQRAPASSPSGSGAAPG